jgi:hypothetical protein
MLFMDCTAAPHARARRHDTVAGHAGSPNTAGAVAASRAGTLRGIR